VLNSDNKKKVHKITNLSMISGMLFWISTRIFCAWNKNTNKTSHM
jgi:hypothetical protein